MAESLNPVEGTNRGKPGIRRRRSLRLANFDYRQGGGYFVTLCGENRACIFGQIASDQLVRTDYGRIVEEAWLWLEKRYPYVVLDAYALMPNHLHAVVILNEGEDQAVNEDSVLSPRQKSLGSLIGAFKTVSTKKINEVRAVPGAIVWQRNFYEHVVRNDQELERIRDYILGNPSRWMHDPENPALVTTT